MKLFRPSEPARRPMSRRPSVVSVLDVGSTKVCCFIARVEDQGNVRVVGVGHQLAAGVRAGAIIDMEAAETSIGAAVHAAEQMAGETIRDVVVNVSGGYPVSHTFNAEVSVPGQEVTDSDVRRALSHARALQILGQGLLAGLEFVGLGRGHVVRDPHGHLNMKQHGKPRGWVFRR